MSTAKVLSMPLAFPEALVKKYQPEDVDDFIGLDVPKRIMQSFIRNPKPDAFYFVGPSGSGKTAMALAVINAIAAEQHHIPSRNCDLETIEEVTRQCHRMPWNMFGPNAGKPSPLHCIHVSEGDQMTGGAQMALLSKMDATAWPPATFFIFTANGSQLLERRFLNRCKIVPFDKPTNGTLAKFLAKVYKAEGGRCALDFEKIAEASEYSVREGLGKIEFELMLGNDRKDLPVLIEKSQADHSHKCGECGHRVDCNESDCRKQAVTKRCPLADSGHSCPGVTTEGSERNRRAWQTRREKKS